MGQQRTGFARTDDGIQLYWRALGDPAAPTIVCCNGVGVSTFFYRHIVDYFRKDFQIVVWDYRGHGRSTSPPRLSDADLSIERNAKDLRTVIQQVNQGQPVILFGHSMGCQVILEFHKQYPELVTALVPMLGTFAKPLDTFMDSKHSRPIFDRIAKITASSSRFSSRLLRPIYASPLALTIGRLTGMVDRYYSEEEDINRYMDHLNHISPKLFFGMVSQMADHDLTEHLPTIAAPTLIFAAEHDLFTPLHRSITMKNSIPNAEMMILPEASHAAIVEYPETINRRIDRFFSQRVFVEAEMAHASR